MNWGGLQAGSHGSVCSSIFTGVNHENFTWRKRKRVFGSPKGISHVGCGCNNSAVRVLLTVNGTTLVIVYVGYYLIYKKGFSLH